MNGYFRLVRAVLGLLIVFLVAFKSHGQSSIEDYLPTRKVNKKIVEDSKKNRPKKTEYMYIYKDVLIIHFMVIPVLYQLLTKWGSNTLLKKNLR